MKKTRFSDEQLVTILREADTKPVPDVAKKHGVSAQPIYGGKGVSVFARPKGPGTVLLMDRYDAMPTLKDMIGHAEDILRVSFCFFQGRPPELKIVRD